MVDMCWGGEFTGGKLNGAENEGRMDELDK